jgi:NADH-quinone oxidoreductase subunit J
MTQSDSTASREVQDIRCAVQEKSNNPMEIITQFIATLRDITTIQVIFLAVGVLVLWSGLMVVTAQNLVHSALWLVVTLFGVAIVYVLLNAGFLAMAQVVIYIGAIAILFIFAVMLTRRVMQDTGSLTNENAYLAFIIAAAVLIGLGLVVLPAYPGFRATAGPLATTDSVVDLGISLVSPSAYLIPFEVASLLLVAALIGAIVVAREKR